MTIQRSLTNQGVINQVLRDWSDHNENASVENLIDIMTELGMLNIADSIKKHNAKLRELELESTIFPLERFNTWCIQNAALNFKIHYKYVLMFLFLVLPIISVACFIFAKQPPAVQEKSTSPSKINVTSLLANDSSNLYRNKSINCKDLHLQSYNIGGNESLKSFGTITNIQIFDKIEITDLNECSEACKSLPSNVLRGVIATKLVMKIKTGDAFEECFFMLVSSLKVQILEIHALEALTIACPTNYAQIPSIRKLMLKSTSTSVGLKNITFNGALLCKILPNLQSFSAKGIISFSGLLDILRHCEQLKNIDTTVRLTKTDGFYNICILSKGKEFKCVHLRFIFDHDTCPPSSDIDALGLEQFKNLSRQVVYEGLDCNTNIVTDEESYRNIVTVNNSFDEEDCDS